jgi:hypothetical protein
LWWCAGADSQLLVRCPNSDRVKMQGLGGMVLATGALAFLSGSYAFYTVFSPRIDTTLSAAQDFTHWPSFIKAGMFGVIWALVIFNIDRFIVGSTGKGDGTDAITWGELGRALPRIAMATVIGVALAAPLEIRILESEIRAELDKVQAQHLAELNEPVIAAAEARKTELKARIDKAETGIREHRTELEKRRIEIKSKYDDLGLEAEGRSRSGKPGEGPAYRTKEAALRALESAMPAFEAEREREIKRLDEEIDRWKQEIADVEAGLSTQVEQHRNQASHKDGLMARIRLAHQIGGWVPYWITALLLCIEVGPIFFKMMLVKGAYDYLEEDRKKLIAARAGIQPDAARLVVGSDNITRHIDVHHGAEAVLAEERRRLETESALSSKVHEEYRKRTEIDIAKNLDDYLERPDKA